MVDEDEDPARTVDDWSFGDWPFDATTAMLTLHSGHRPAMSIDDATITAWARRLSATSHQRVRTNAVGPSLAERLVGIGFQSRQELELLVREAAPVPQRGARWRTRSIGHRDAVRIDVASFGDEWALDDAGLRHAIGATTSSRLRGVAPRGSLGPARRIGYCLTGVTDDVGYLQRLAVVPSRRRGGAAWALLADSIAWASARGAKRVYVNTDVGNGPALSLYRQWGFASVGYHLRVLECDRTVLLAHIEGSA